MIRKTAHFADKIFTIQTPDNVRALPAEELAEAVREHNLNAEAKHSIREAVEEAFAIAKPEDVILAFGSLSFIGVLTEAVKQYKTTERGN